MTTETEPMVRLVSLKCANCGEEDTSGYFEFAKAENYRGGYIGDVFPVRWFDSFRTDPLTHWCKDENGDYGRVLIAMEPVR